MSEGVTASEQSPLPGIWRGVRWGLAFVLLVLYGLAVFSRLYSECTIARTATTLRATCAPPTVTSSTAIVLLALVLVLLLPDLLRLRVGAGMRDRLERVEQSSRATQRDVDELSNAVLDVRPHAVPVQVAQADSVEEEIARWGREQSARLEEEWRRIGADDPTLQGVRAADVSSEAERRYRTVGELALRWERLRQLLRLTPH